MSRMCGRGAVIMTSSTAGGELIMEMAIVALDSDKGASETDRAKQRRVAMACKEVPKLDTKVAGT